LGGGKSNFVRPDVNLAKAFEKDGYSYVTDKNQMLKDKNEQVLGLFASEGLPKMIDRPSETPSVDNTDQAKIIFELLKK
jgi:alkaline phosphatase